jgi:hypothetical protein
MVNFVIAKYTENVDWTKKLIHKFTIYDKSDNPISGSIPLKNIGREGETFLYHIVNNYNNLDDVTVFLQGNPFDHLQILVGWRSLINSEIDIVIDKMNQEINDICEFTTFYQVLYNDPNFTNGVNIKAAGIQYYGERHDYFTVCPGAQYIVPKKYILSRSLEFWKTLQLAMYNNEELNGYCQEQLWYLAFKHEINKNVGNHDQEKHRRLSLSAPNFNYTPYSYFTENNISV